MTDAERIEEMEQEVRNLRKALKAAHESLRDAAYNIRQLDANVDDTMGIVYRALEGEDND